MSFDFSPLSFMPSNAPDWATWEQNSNLLPPAAQGNSMPSGMSQAGGGMYVPPDAQPTAAQAAGQPNAMNSALTALMPALMNPNTAAAAPATQALTQAVTGKDPQPNTALSDAASYGADNPNGAASPTTTQTAVTPPPVAGSSTGAFPGVLGRLQGLFNPSAAGTPAAPAAAQPAQSPGIYTPQAATAPPQAPQAPQTPQTLSPGESPGPRNYSSLTPLVVGASGGWGQTNKNPNGTANGPGDFTDDTWKAFLASPANTGKWTMADRTNPDAVSAAIPWYGQVNDNIFQSKLGRPATQDELLASHMLGGGGAAALAANPQAPAYDTLKAIQPQTVDQVFNNNGKLFNRNMTGADALSSAIGYFHRGTPAGSAPPASPTLATTTAGPNPQQQGASPGFTDFLPPGMIDASGRLKLPYDAAQLQMPGGSKLLALAAGILSGRSLGNGLGKGFQNLNEAQMADLANKREINSQAMQLANVGLLSQYRMGMLANGQQRANAATTNANNNTVRTDANYTPGGRQQLASAGALGKSQGGEQGNDIDELNEGYQDSQVRGQQIDAMKKLVSSGQVATGPGIAALKRGLSNYFGVDLGSDPTQTQITEQQASAIRGTSAFAKNMRNVREFNSLMQGLPGLDLQNPKALMSTLTAAGNLNNLQQQMSTDWVTGMKDEDRAPLMANPQALQQWKANEVDRWRSGLGEGGLYGTASAPNASAPTSATPNATSKPVTGSYNGVSYSFQPGQ